MKIRELFEHTDGNPTVNNLGMPIAHSQEALARFWRWFGNSKAADQQGRPLVLFHGTAADFRAFEPERSNSNTGTGVPHGTFMFANSPDIAQSYAGQTTRMYGFATDAQQREYDVLVLGGDMDAALAYHKKHAIENHKTFAEGGNVMPVYLRIVKPLVVNARGENWRRIWRRSEEWTTNDLMNYAEAKGYDGLIVRNVHDRAEGRGKPGDIYAVFSPTQIKSAIGNAGGFDPEKPEIDEEERQ